MIKNNQVPFWGKKWNGKLCGITKTRLRPGRNKNGFSYSIFLTCSHGFYRSVLVEWIKNCPRETPTCPICRQDINYSDMYKKQN